MPCFMEMKFKILEIAQCENYALVSVVASDNDSDRRVLLLYRQVKETEALGVEVKVQDMDGALYALKGEKSLNEWRVGDEIWERFYPKEADVRSK